MKRLSLILAAVSLCTAAYADTTQAFGDINKDGVINVSDVTMLATPILNNAAFNIENDINGDGLCNVSDVTYLVECILTGKMPARPVACVDLGLSVTWAAYNLGATSEEQAGNYYAWGETATKDNYSEGNSATYNKNMTSLMASSVIGSNGELTPAYDAATAALGDEWRMPTKAEVEELFNKCTWENCDDYFPILGVKLTGPNGQSIFLPEAGQKSGSSVIHEGFYGYFWTATCDEMADGFGESKGISLGFTSKDMKWVTSNVRYIGLPIRPVKN